MISDATAALAAPQAGSVAARVAVVIPSYKVTAHILGVIAGIGPEVARIYVVDDKCPDSSGTFVEENCRDDRVVVLRCPENLGVGGAVMTGYKAALTDDMDIMVKLDGDGQMAPELIPDFIAPILSAQADYTKGNRFFDLEGIRSMPRVRLIGNAILSFMTKLSSGYWDLFDPTNGYTAIHADVARHLPFHKISSRYFFESDMLFRLNILRAKAIDIPMEARYGSEVSNLKISKVVGEFTVKHLRNFGKRIFYNYYLRDMSPASLELPLGLGLFLFGVVFGIVRWYESAQTGISASTGTVMLSVLPILTGLQFLMAFVAYDVASNPKQPVHTLRRNRRKTDTPTFK